MRFTAFFWQLVVGGWWRELARHDAVVHHINQPISHVATHIPTHYWSRLCKYSAKYRTKNTQGKCTHFKSVTHQDI